MLNSDHGIVLFFVYTRLNFHMSLIKTYKVHWVGSTLSSTQHSNANLTSWATHCFVFELYEQVTRLLKHKLIWRHTYGNLKFCLLCVQASSSFHDQSVWFSFTIFDRIYFISQFETSTRPTCLGMIRSCTCNIRQLYDYIGSTLPDWFSGAGESIPSIFHSLFNYLFSID